jgi:hypothetical protein
MAVFRPLGPLGNTGGKHQAGGIFAFSAIGFRQQFQYFHQLWLGHGFKTGRDGVSVFPGIVDFPFEPLDYFTGFRFIL